MRCPVCKAVVEQSTQCRRCKAELSLLVQLENHGQQLLAHAAQLGIQGRFAEAQQQVEQAGQLHSTDECQRLLALLALLRRDFPQAWGLYQEQTGKSQVWASAE
jgi:hypothetical protein